MRIPSCDAPVEGDTGIRALPLASFVGRSWGERVRGVSCCCMEPAMVWSCVSCWCTGRTGLGARVGGANGSSSPATVEEVPEREILRVSPGELLLVGVLSFPLNFTVCLLLDF